LSGQLFEQALRCLLVLEHVGGGDLGEVLAQIVIEARAQEGIGTDQAADAGIRSRVRTRAGCPIATSRSADRRRRRRQRRRRKAASQGPLTVGSTALEIRFPKSPQHTARQECPE